jgi:rhodanese-related sulfurtransferase
MRFGEWGKGQAMQTPWLRKRLKGCMVEMEREIHLLCSSLYIKMKLVRAFLLFSLAGFLHLEAQVVDSLKYKSLDPYYFHLEYLKQDSSLLLDVRQPFEFKGKRLKDAINIPSSKELNILADTLSKDYSLFLYCSTDYRSRNTAEKLYDIGFRKLYNLEGGIVAWRKEGMPVIKGRERRAESGERRAVIR